MIFGTCLNGLCPVQLLENHDAGQMMGEGHGTHGKFEIRLSFHTGRHTEGGANEKAGTAFAGQFDFLQLVREFLAGQFPAFRGKYAEPGAFGDFGENQLSFLLQTGSDFGRGGIFREPHFREPPPEHHGATVDAR